MTPFANLMPKAFEEQINAGKTVVVLDVRTPEEFESGHLPQAINIDFRNPNFTSEIDDLDKEQSYFVYCRSGARSASASGQMNQMGFSKVANMLGGIMAWHGEVI